MKIKNVLARLPDDLTDEVVEPLMTAAQVRIERIVSRGHCSPPGFWYDQGEHEWVVLLHGRARLAFDDEPSPTELAAGDFLEIPAHRRHRVEWTDPNQDTVWLAVFYR